MWSGGGTEIYATCLTVTDQKTQDTGDKGKSSKTLAQSLGKLIALALVVIVALLIEHYCSYKPPAFGPDAKIAAIDGDTLRAGNGDQYRIFGIDAPELHQTCKDASGKSWLCGRAAKAKLTTLMKTGGVNCEARSNDSYGRIVAVCTAQGTPDLGEAMVRAATPSISAESPAIPIRLRRLRRRMRSAASGAGPSTAPLIGVKPILARIERRGRALDQSQRPMNSKAMSRQR